MTRPSMTISAWAGTLSGTVRQAASSTFFSRNRPANWYSESVSGTGVTAAIMVAGSAPITAAAGKPSRRSSGEAWAFQRANCWAPPRWCSQRISVVSRPVTCIR